VDLYPVVLNGIHAAADNRTNSALTAAQIRRQQRRLEAGRLLQTGLSRAKVAREVGCSLASVGAWAARIKRGGVAALDTEYSRGRPAKLQLALRETVVEALLQYPSEYADPARGWTRASVRKLLHDQFGISYSTPYLSRLLRNLGFCFDPQAGWIKSGGHNAGGSLDVTHSTRLRLEHVDERSG
jgi:transposase